MIYFSYSWLEEGGEKVGLERKDSVYANIGSQIYRITVLLEKEHEHVLHFW